MRSSLGVSLGAANLIAVADGRPTVRRATVTLAPPSLTGFVDRVGDPVPLVAADGSRHLRRPVGGDAIETVTRLARPHRRARRRGGRRSSPLAGIGRGGRCAPGCPT
ncbi:hypothetical protein [Mycolicibacterium vanbaalenii]|uniref:hypothetical protein n=1 Tax=Mycolicibacterium vanbaalenii TaxID=110539 RepID=UPI0021F2812B|nr:hypothetical protein [Mycolicibacterium vanbaalenii]